MPQIAPLRSFDCVQLPYYPHMLDADAVLWHHYLKTNPFPEGQVIYDLHVGTPSPIAENTPESYRRMILSLSTLRIDALVLLPTESIVFEIKPRAGLYAIGQAYCYAQLVRRDMPQFPNPVATILTDKARADTQWLCNRLKIILIELD